MTWIWCPRTCASWHVRSGIHNPNERPVEIQEEISTTKVSAGTESSQEIQDADQATAAIAAQIGEDPAHLVQRKDVTKVLEHMQEGVTITLHISRPRFWRKLTLDDLGLAVDGAYATSEAASQVLNDYFQLGRRSLLPKLYQDKLQAAENSARYCLAKYSFKSHWGAFVPRTAYQQWLKDNASYEATFLALREEIVSHYEQIVEQVIEDFRPLAEDAWQRVTLGKGVLKHLDRLSAELLAEVVERLQAGHGKEAFIENYLATIRRAMPDQQTVAAAFAYEYERGVIPLPSLLASDMEQADRIYRERTLRDAKVRAELEAIEAQRRAEMQKLSAQQQQEREEQYQRLRTERERQRQQLEMERDVLLDARRQKERLVQGFYAGVVAQINRLIWDVSENIRGSLDTHNGRLRGPVSAQLRHLITQLEQLNFVEDEDIEQQIARLQSI